MFDATLRFHPCIDCIACALDSRDEEADAGDHIEGSTEIAVSVRDGTFDLLAAVVSVISRRGCPLRMGWGGLMVWH